MLTSLQTIQGFTGDPDEDILPELKAQNNRAFNILVDRHASSLSALAAQMLGDVHMAEDITQSVFLKTWQMLPNWETGRAKLVTWMRRVSTNMCLDYLRKHKPVYTDMVPEIASEDQDQQEQLETEQRNDLIQTHLDRLNERQRAALTLFYYQDLSLKESAEIMEISPDAFESLLRRARQQLKTKMSGDF